MQNSPLYTPIEYLKGIGPTKADVLKKELNIFTFFDFLQHFPFRYVDKSKFYTIKEINPEMPFIQLKGKIIEKGFIGQKRAKRFSATFMDNTGELELVWFQGLRWIENSIQLGSEIIVFGKPNYYKNQINIIHPEIELFSETKIENQSKLQAVYPSTEKLKAFGLDSKGILKTQRILFEQVKKEIKENLPNFLLDNYKLPARMESFQEVHFPKDAKSLQRAEARLKFEELFFHQIKLLKLNKNRKMFSKGPLFSLVAENFNTFYSDYLPFKLTNAQKKVIKEIRQNTNTGKQMNRLLQGDVGSGKTVVALMSMLMALDNGYQSCMMAPTEILAQQHFESLSTLLNQMPIKIELLTGSSKTKHRKVLLEQLEKGEIDILLGTHALIEDVVKFKNLGLVVIDEQHRFGVEQRAKLWKKAIVPPHILVMTATPIPRTLAMTLYGDLDVSVINELPPGRKPITTEHWFDNHRLKLFGFMKSQIALGRQIYVVYPLINESEKMDYKDLMDGYEGICREFPMPKYQVSIVHGKMKSKDKDFEMQRFVRGETQIMVATTVIEVGVNVPNASVMVIESAERFGLSQLHQLRGRVGRGSNQSFCILMSGNKLSKDSKVRLQTMVESNDGFEISEIDLQLRGPGDLQGTQQSGVLDLKISNLAKDQIILQEARGSAMKILEEDPDLKLEKHQLLFDYFENKKSSANLWERIS